MLGKGLQTHYVILHDLCLCPFRFTQDKLAYTQNLIAILNPDLTFLSFVPNVTVSDPAGLSETRL